MKNLSWVERLEAFKEVFPDNPDIWPAVVPSGRWLQMNWLLGCNFGYTAEARATGLAREKHPYHRDLLPRLLALFPDRDRLLHVFSGLIPPSEEYDTLDIDPRVNPTFCCDFQGELPYAPETYDLVIIDLDLEGVLTHGRNGALVRRNVIRPDSVKNNFVKSICPGGYGIWIDTMFPPVPKEVMLHCGMLSFYPSSFRAGRAAHVFRKQGSLSVCPAPQQQDPFEQRLRRVDTELESVCNAEEAP